MKKKLQSIQMLRFNKEDNSRQCLLSSPALNRLRPRLIYVRLRRRTRPNWWQGRSSIRLVYLFPSFITWRLIRVGHSRAITLPYLFKRFSMWTKNGPVQFVLVIISSRILAIALSRSRRRLNEWKITTTGMVIVRRNKFVIFSFDAGREGTVGEFRLERWIVLAVGKVCHDSTKKGADEDVMPVVYIKRSISQRTRKIIQALTAVIHCARNCNKGSTAKRR